MPKLPFVGYYPTGALDHAHNYYLTYEVRVRGVLEYSVMFVKRMETTQTWSEPKIISNGIGYAEMPSIAVHKQHIEVVFQARPYPSNLAIIELHLVRSDDGGKTWNDQVVKTNAKAKRKQASKQPSTNKK